MPILAVVALLLLPGGVVSQDSSPSSVDLDDILSHDPTRRIEISDSLYRAGEPAAALEWVRAAADGDSADYGALWRAARASVVVGLNVEGTRAQNHWLDPAIGWGWRAVQAEPEGIDGLYWRGVAAGRRAMNAAPSYAVDLAQLVYDDAHSILALLPDHGGAHNMLGKLNYEIMTLSRIKRAVARTFMGNSALDDTTWGNAEYHLAKAVLSEPDVVLFNFDLAQLHARRGRRDVAIEVFQTLLRLPATEPIDSRLHDQAREMLHEWGVSTGAGPTDR